MPEAQSKTIDTEALAQMQVYLAMNTPLADALDDAPHLCVLSAALLHSLRAAPPQELAWFEVETQGWILVVPDATPTWRRSPARPVG